MTARIMKIYDRNPKSSLKNATSELTPHDVEKAELFWISEAQQNMGKDIENRKYIYIICRPGGPYWEKLCQRSWVRPEAAGRGPCSRPRAQFFSIRTDQGRQIIFLFFSCCFSKVKRVLLFSESNVLQARVKWTMKRSRLWHQSSKIRFFTLLKLRNHRKQYN